MAARPKLPLSRSVLLASGRASYEITQKALVAGSAVICPVSAPSSLAVDVARRFELTLIGFLRGRRFTIYRGAERVMLAAPKRYRQAVGVTASPQP